MIKDLKNIKNKFVKASQKMGEVKHPLLCTFLFSLCLSAICAPIAVSNINKSIEEMNNFNNLVTKEKSL